MTHQESDDSALALQSPVRMKTSVTVAGGEDPSTPSTSNCVAKWLTSELIYSCI